MRKGLFEGRADKAFGAHKSTPTASGIKELAAIPDFRNLRRELN
jgi:hypothetical protein